jgi:hypothetical protein
VDEGIKDDAMWDGKIDSRLARDSRAKDSRQRTDPGQKSGWRASGVTEGAYSGLLEVGFGRKFKLADY